MQLFRYLKYLAEIAHSRDDFFWTKANAEKTAFKRFSGIEVPLRLNSFLSLPAKIWMQMAIVKPLKGISPKIGENVFLAENAVVIGDVEIGKNCSIWYGAVIRGDVHYIRIGNNTNVQDNAVIHGTYQKSPTNIGNNVIIAHGAIIHGCTLKDNVMIGMNAVILDDAVVESNTIVAAGSVVTKGTKVESGSVYAGIPAKKVKEISPELLEGEIYRIAEAYGVYASWYK